MARPRKVVEPPVTELVTVTNCLKGTDLHLGDDRRLAFGESAEVTGELAAFLIERGQAK